MQTALDHYLTDRSEQEDLDFEAERAEEALGDAIRAARGYPDELYELACEVLGNSRVATLLTDALENCDIELVIDWRARKVAA